MKTSKLLQTAAAALAVCSGFAQASPVVTLWTVTDVATFVPGSGTPGGIAFPKPVFSAGNTQLHWGNVPLASQSGLIIGNSGTSVAVTTGVLTSTVTAWHDNFAIPGGDSLTAIDILASLTLQSAAPSVGGVLPGALTFGVRFIETTNQPGTGALCADGGVNNVGININQWLCRHLRDQQHFAQFPAYA